MVYRHRRRDAVGAMLDIQRLLIIKVGELLNDLLLAGVCSPVQVGLQNLNRILLPPLAHPESPLLAS